MKFQKLTRCGYEYRIYASEDTEHGQIHGAIKSIISGRWISNAWVSSGRINTSSEHNWDLLPEKKRRFKTAEELVANQYDRIVFLCNGLVEVTKSCNVYQRWPSDVPEGNYSEEWLNVFTVEENI